MTMPESHLPPPARSARRRRLPWVSTFRATAASAARKWPGGVNRNSPLYPQRRRPRCPRTYPAPIPTPTKRPALSDAIRTGSNPQHRRHPTTSTAGNGIEGARR